jgi:hypothetical protein
MGLNLVLLCWCMDSRVVRIEILICKQEYRGGTPLKNKQTNKQQQKRTTEDNYMNRYMFMVQHKLHKSQPSLILNISFFLSFLFIAYLRTKIYKVIIFRLVDYLSLLPSRHHCLNVSEGLQIFNNS